MLITDILAADRVFLDVRVKDKAHLLQELASRCEPAGVPSTEVLAALQAREALGSTGLGKGFALPHARLEGVTGCFGMLVRLARPIDYAAIDGQKVDVLVLLLTPTDADSTHMAALSLVARTVRQNDTIGRIRRAEGANSVMNMLSEG